MDFIKDGSGHGYSAAVNSRNRLLTRSTSVEQRLRATIMGNYYEASTGLITVTDAVHSYLMYIENSNPLGKVIVIDRVFVDVWESTGGTSAGKIAYYKNPNYTGGTNIVPYNTKFDSQVLASGTFLKTPTTLTEDNHWWYMFFPKTGGSFVIEEGRIVVNSGRSFGVGLYPPPGNTNMEINLNVDFYYLDLAAEGEDL